MTELRIATRASELALAQARSVQGQLARTQPGLEVSLVEVTTTGDRDQVTSVATLTEVGAFVRAVQEAVLEGHADIAVHSCKDLPVDGPRGLTAIYPKREAPWDVLCGHDLESLPDGGRVGTGSPRRAAQMHGLRPDVETVEIRGNVGTRLEKMRSGAYDALILAEAGLRRLGREDEIRHRFTLGEMVPAPAQAALAVEIKEDDPRLDLLMAIDDPDTRVAVETERALLAETRAGCRSALGVYGEVRGAQIHLTGFVEDDRGPRHAEADGSSPNAVSRSLQARLGL
jgi:hydroxymethylbilane synthase